MFATGTALLLALAQASGIAKITVTKDSPPEAKLASIDAKSATVPRSAVTLFALHLDSLDRKCTEDRVAIADITAKGVQLLAQKKVPMTHLKFIESMDGALPSGSESLGLSCAEIGAMLVTMIERP